MNKKEKYIHQESLHTWFKEGTVVDTLFTDGTIKRYDVMNLATKYPELYELRDNRKLFLSGKDWGFAIVWTDKLDIDIEDIYYDGKDVTIEYKDYEQYLVGYKLRQLRYKKDMSQEELSALTDIDQATISKIEKGSMNPSVKTIMKIVRALNGKVELKIK